MARSSEGPYRVGCSAVVKKRLKGLLAKADRLDAARRRLFRRAFNTAIARLSSNPLTWGEQERSLEHSGLPIYHAVSSVLNVYYTVVEDKHTVLIKSIEPVPTFPLETGPDENA